MAGFSGFGNIGLPAAERPRIGFAAYAKQTGSLAKYLNETLLTEEPTQVAGRKRPPKEAREAKPVPENYPWPDIIVARRINKPKAGARWREFDKTLDVRARRIGRAVNLANLQCVYLSAEEMNNALTERYGAISHDENPKRRFAVGREVVEKINSSIRDIQQKSELKDRLRPNVDNLEEQLLRGRYEIATAVDESEAVLSDVEQLWTPQSFTVGQQEGCGPKIIGVSLEDEDGILATERRELVSRVCGSLALNPLHFISQDFTPSIEMVHTSPLPVDGLHFNLPPMPLTMPLRAPHAFMQ